MNITHLPMEHDVGDPDVIETVAKAIRFSVVGRTATPWHSLPEYQRETYREQARAALNEIDTLRRKGSGA